MINMKVVLFRKDKNFKEICIISITFWYLMHMESYGQNTAKFESLLDILIFSIILNRLNFKGIILKISKIISSIMHKNLNLYYLSFLKKTRFMKKAIIFIGKQFNSFLKNYHLKLYRSLIKVMLTNLPLIEIEATCFFQRFWFI